MKTPPVNDQSAVVSHLSSCYAALHKTVYGQRGAKKKLIEMFNNMILNPNIAQPYILLVGPPGIGKTTLLREAVSSCFGLQSKKISLGGVNDGTLLSGDKSLWVGSKEGEFARTFIHSQVMNMHFHFDELDDISNDEHGKDLQSQLMVVTDHVVNKEFMDNNLVVSFDLSHSIFTFTANDPHKIKPALLSRMTVIHLDGYNNTEKTVIAKTHVIPKLLKNIHLSAAEITFDEDLLSSIIDVDSDPGMRTIVHKLESVVSQLGMLLTITPLLYEQWCVNQNLTPSMSSVIMDSNISSMLTVKLVGNQLPMKLVGI